MQAAFNVALNESPMDNVSRRALRVRIVRGALLEVLLADVTGVVAAHRSPGVTTTLAPVAVARAESRHCKMRKGQRQDDAS